MIRMITTIPITIFDTDHPDLLEEPDEVDGLREEGSHLLAKEQEWDDNGRHRDYLLRGTALENAEFWLLQAADKRLSSNSLVEEFIAASRTEKQGGIIGFVRRLFSNRNQTLPNDRPVDTDYNANLIQQVEADQNPEMTSNRFSLEGENLGSYQIKRLIR